MPLRICILETDVLRTELREQYRGYGHMFERLFAQQSITVSFEIFNVMQGCYPDAAERYDAYLVTGSKADSFAPDEWIQTLKAFLLKCYARGDKLLGICFGHQLLALILGGQTARAPQGWGVGIHCYQVHQQLPWMQPSLAQLTLLISHQDQVMQLPPDATLLASSDFCAHAAFCIGDQVLCFQGHPEFVSDYSRALLDIRRACIGEPAYSTAYANLDQAHQGVSVAHWMMHFVQGAQGY